MGAGGGGTSRPCEVTSLDSLQLSPQETLAGAGLGIGFTFLLETCWSIFIPLNLCLRAKTATPCSPSAPGSTGAKAECTVGGLQTPRCTPDFSSSSSPGDQRPQELHGPWGETCVRELAQAQEIQLSRRLQRARPSLPRGSFFWCAFADPAGQPLPASSCQTPQPRAAPRHEPPATGPTYIHLRDAILVCSCSSGCQQPLRPRRGAGLRSSSFGTSPAACSAPVLTVDLNKKSAENLSG